MSSFDLKREMEILRKNDEEVATVKFKQKNMAEEFSVHIVEDEEEEKSEEVAEASATKAENKDAQVMTKSLTKSQKMEAEYLKLKA